MNTYDIGDLVTITLSFKNAAGTASNPTTINLYIHQPDGTVVSKTNSDMTNPSTGIWKYDFAPTQAGSHLYRGVGSGAVVAVDEAVFRVRKRRVPAS